MKKLILDILPLNDDKRGSYYILIPPYRRVYFSNKKDAEEHVRFLKKVLFDNISILSSIQTDLYSMYRQYYFQLPLLTSEKLIFDFHSFDNQINFVFKIYTEGNQSYVFSKIQVLFNLLDNVSHRLLRFAKSKNSHANLVVKINSILKQLSVFNEHYEKECFLINSNLDVYRKQIKVVHLNSLKNEC